MTNRMTPAQIRGALGLLDWSIVHLARAAQVPVSVIREMQRGETTSPSLDVSLAVWDAFHAAGVRFSDEPDGIGVKVRTDGYTTENSIR